MMDLTVITTYEITFSNNKTVSGESVALLEFVRDGEELLLRTNKLILVRLLSRSGTSMFERKN